MRNNELLNGISAIERVNDAFHALVGDVDDISRFEDAAEQVLSLIIQENTALTNAGGVSNVVGGSPSNLGYCNIPVNTSFHSSRRISNILKKYIPHYFDGNAIKVPVKIDFSKPLSVLIEFEGSNNAASVLSEYILFASLNEKSGMNFRCVDLVSGGSFFASALTLVPKFSTRSGGRVYSKREDFSELLRELEESAEKAMSRLGGGYSSVWEYNEKNQDKIPEYINIIRLDGSGYYQDELNKLKVLIRNSQRNGMSFVVVCDGNLQRFFGEVAGIHLRVSTEGMFLGSAARLPFMSAIKEQDQSDMLAQISSSMQQADKVDTLYENHPELHSSYFTMDSASALRIPFAIDKFNRVQYFEIGGNAPPHALIAGSTGSGKSSVLHTLIMQTIHHYHPDDVEIWAIDYKAVEFNFYIQNPTPHFRVIAHDTSTEFSLSLIDLLYKEYEKRQKAFLDAKAKDIEAYRKKCGKHSMPRILVVVDEFQLMTQAVMEYNGYKDYRTELENLLRLTRAMGISFVFSSQTIASGLQGLSDAARDQIGCRLCLKHEDDNEIWETLTLSGPDANKIVYQAKELRRGQGIYKRARWANEYSPDGKGYEFLQSHILFLNEEIRSNMISEINEIVGDRYTPKDTITVRGGGRISIEEKVRHPLQKFMNMDYEPEEEVIEWYPAAPASLADYFRVDIEQTGGANILMVGEQDDLRDSVVTHSICGFLMNPQTQVIANFIDEQNPDRRRMIDILRNINSPRFDLRVGVDAVMDTIRSLQKIRPSYDSKTIYLWYGLDKLKNAIFLKTQEDEVDDAPPPPSPADAFSLSGDMDLDELIALAGAAIESGNTEFGKPDNKTAVVGEILEYDQCVSILKTAFDAGPENGKFHFVIFNNVKSMKRSAMVALNCFENIVGTKISTDDAYALFGNGHAVDKADKDTVIYSSGGDKFTPLRPYMLPDAKWFDKLNRALRFIT